MRHNAKRRPSPRYSSDEQDRYWQFISELADEIAKTRDLDARENQLFEIVDNCDYLNNLTRMLEAVRYAHMTSEQYNRIRPIVHEAIANDVRSLLEQPGCYHCGYENKPGAQSCRACGHDL